MKIIIINMDEYKNAFVMLINSAKKHLTEEEYAELIELIERIAIAQTEVEHNA